MVCVQQEDDIEVLYTMINKTFERQSRRNLYSKETIEKIDKYLKEKNSRVCLSAIDENGKYHAATYFVYDEKRCYYLMSGGDPELRNSGATSLLIWEGIKFASEHSLEFDFEGSMIEDIERFVRAWGAQPKIYFHITKYKGIYRIIQSLKPTIKKILRYK